MYRTVKWSAAATGGAKSISRKQKRKIKINNWSLESSEIKGPLGTSYWHKLQNDTISENNQNSKRRGVFTSQDHCGSSTARDNIVLPMEQKRVLKARRSRPMCWISAQRKLMGMLLLISKRTRSYLLNLGTLWKELVLGWVDFVKRRQTTNVEGNKLWWCDSTVAWRVVQKQMLSWPQHPLLGYFILFSCPLGLPPTENRRLPCPRGLIKRVEEALACHCQ